MNRLNAFFTRLIGVNREYLEAIKDSHIMHHLTFRGMAIALGTAAFATAVFTFATGLLGYSIFSASVFAGVSGFVLFMIERNNIMETLATGQVSGKAVATRFGVISMMIGAALSLAIYAMKEPIDARIAEWTRRTMDTLAVDPRYSVPLTAAQATVGQSAKDVTRQSTLLYRLNQLDADHAKAKEAERNECEGNTTPDGVQRIAWCGSRSRAHKAAAERIDLERQGVRRELASLERGQPAAAAATSRLREINEAMRNEAERLNQGAGAKLRALYELFWTDGSVATILAFYLSLSLLPEILVWTALAKPGIYQPMLQRMQQMETMVNNNRLDVLAEAKRDQYTQELPLRHVHVPHPTKGTDPKSDTNPVDTPPPGDGSGRRDDEDDDGAEESRRVA